MNANTTKPFVLLFVLVIFQLKNIYSQSLTTTGPTTDAEVKFQLEVPSLEPSEPPIGDPFYQGFMIFGDGNFLRLRSPEFDLSGAAFQMTETGSYQFTHNYLNYTNEYPPLLLLIDRKSGDDPPDTQFVQPGGVGGTLQIVPDPATTLNDRVWIRENVTPGTAYSPEPQSPMIQGNAKVALGYSHHNYNSNPGELDRNRYFLLSDRVGAFPVAYKPRDEGKLLFFFQSADDSELQYYDEITINGEEVGTILSNYGNDSFSGLVDRMRDVVVLNPASTGNIEFPQWYNVNNLKNFDRVIVSDITSYEEEAYRQGGEDEIRQFHFIKNKILKAQSYYFIAALYDKNTAAFDTENYLLDSNRLSPLIMLPSKLEFPPNGKEYSFVDAEFLKIEYGEPEDPNGLEVTKICKCNDRYKVSFTLTFCNDSATAATGANVALHNIDLLESEDIDPRELLSCFRLSDIKPEDVADYCELESCDDDFCSCGFGDNLNFDPIHQKYCLKFGQTKIIAGTSDSCGQITFTTFISSDKIHLLTEKPLIKFCVSLYNFPCPTEMPAICGFNKVLDTLDVTINENQFLVPNEVWRQRDQVCGRRACKCKNLGKQPFFLFRWLKALFS